MPSNHSNDDEESTSETQLLKFFFYGTLKKNEPNHHFLQERNIKFLADAITMEQWPLIVASDANLPFLLNKQGYGHNIHGEIYLVDQDAKKFLDEFEGVDDGIYSLIRIAVKDSKTGTLHSVYSYMLDKFNENILEGAILLDNYSSKNPFYDSYKRDFDFDNTENKDQMVNILKQIK